MASIFATEVAEQYLDSDDITVVKEQNPSTEVNLCFNNKRVPQKIRQAIDRGLNKQDILDKIYGGNGIINYSLVFPTYPGYTEKDIYDVEGAKALVGEAIADGDWTEDTVLIIGVTNTQTENVAILIRDLLKSIGINAEIKQDEMTTIQKAMTADTGEGNDYQYSCALWSLGATYFPTKMMNMLALYADYVFFHNDPSDIYPIYTRYMVVQPVEDEKAVIADFQNWEYENVPQSTIVQYGAYSATSPRISNVDLFNTTNFNYASWLWEIN